MSIAARVSQAGNPLPSPQIVSRDHEARPNSHPSLPPDEPPRWPTLVLVLTGVLSLVAGALVIIGWHTGYILSTGASLFESVPVRYNTGVCFLFGGSSLLLLARDKIRWSRAAGVSMAAIGLLTVCEYLSNRSLGIDTLIFNVARIAPSIEPRMAPNTAVCFTLLGGALLLTSKKKRALRNNLQAFTAALVAVLGLVGFIGYMAHVPTAYGWGRFTPMAAPTAAVMVALGLGGIALAWRQYTAESGALPPWSALLGSLTVAAGSVALWQSLHLLHPDQSLDTLALTVGLVQAVFLYLVLHLLRTTRERARWLHQLNAELQIQVHSVERAESELRGKQAYTRSLIEASIDPLVTIGADGQITDVNAATEAATGHSRDELIGTDFCDYFTDPARARTGYQQVFREGGVRDYELEIRHRDGRITPVLYNASIYRDQAGAIAGVFAAARDVSERHHGQAALRQLAAIVEFSEDAIISKSLDGTIVTWNKAAERLYGYRAAEAIGQNMRIIVPPELHEELDILLRRVGQGEYIAHHDTVRMRRDGSRVDVSVSLSPVKDSAGNTTGVSTIVRDITDRKRMEAVLRHSSRYTRSLIEASLDLLVTIAADGKITDVNAATEAVTGCSRQELIGSDFSNYFTEPDKARAGYQQVFAEGRVKNYPLAIRHRSGRVTDVLYNASVFRNQAGAVEGVFAAARDVTERKRLEEELRARQAYTRSLIESSLDPLVTIAPDGKITDVNAATEAATGHSRQELIGTDFCDYFTHPERAQAGYQQVFREGGVRDYELEIRHRDGRITPVLYNASIYHDQMGSVEGVFAAARDVTLRKEAERALRASDDRYRALLGATAQVVWTTPADGLVEDMPMWRAYTGQTQAEVRGWGWLNAIHPDDRESTAAIWSQAVASRGLYETEYRIRGVDGQYRHFAIRGVPVLEQGGSIREWVGTCTDIHERKQIEDELRKHAVLLNLAHDAIMVTDLQYRITFWNRGAEEIYGWGAKEASGRMSPELLHTEFPVPLPEIRAAVQKEGEWEGELKHLTRDGRKIVVASRWSLQRDHHGAPTNVLEINRDITERKHLENELRAQQVYTRSLIEASLDPLVTIAPDGRITDVNRTTEEITGVARTQLVGSDFCDYFTEPEKARAGYQQVFAEGRVQDYALAIRHRSGRVTEVLYNASVYRNEAGEVEGVFAAARDITERKLLENELRAKQAYTRSLIEASLDPLVTIASDGKITDVNRATEQITGVDRAELVGSDFSTYFTEPEKARAGYRQVFAEGLVEDYSLAIRHRSGRVKEVLYNASVFRDPAGEVEGVFAAARDITERKRLEEGLRQRTGELENAVAELEAFSYSVSHDLRAPLRSIDGFSQILLEDYQDKVDAEGQDSLRRIRAASQNMAQLIDALLQLSRVMRAELSRETVELSILALSTAAMIQKADPRPHLHFGVAAGLQVRGDRRLLGIALQNLLQNAWKFSARNSDPIIEFGSISKDGQTAYYVRDNGIGFDMTYANKLFTPFQRLHSKEQFEGTGIGLATVQRIIKRHGGRVWAEGAVGKGATFYFSLE